MDLASSAWNVRAVVVTRSRAANVRPSLRTLLFTVFPAFVRARSSRSVWMRAAGAVVFFGVVFFMFGSASSRFSACSAERVTDAMGG